MSLSVVIPTYNQRPQLRDCLDALLEGAIDAEIIIVNGPSTDGTSGMIQDRTDVDVLIECSSRNLNMARNAGIDAASGDVIAFLAPPYEVPPDWADTIYRSIDGGADAVTGPVRAHTDPADADTDIRPDGHQLPVTAGNIALSRGAIMALDGFDEYLTSGGMVDFGQRFRGLGLQSIWHPDMAVTGSTAPISGVDRSIRFVPGVWHDASEPDWGEIYRSRSYLAVKNRGVRPRVLFELARAAVSDGVGAARDVANGLRRPTQWVGNGITVARNIAIGVRDGVHARQSDGTAARNPHGLSQSRAAETIAARHDWREPASE